MATPGPSLRPAPALQGGAPVFGRRLTADQVDDSARALCAVRAMLLPADGAEVPGSNKKARHEEVTLLSNKISNK